AKIFENSVIPRSYLNTIVYTTCGTLINIGMTALMAYPLSKSRLAGRGVIMKMILFTMFFSGGTIPTFLVVKDLKMLDTIWSLILPNAIWTTNLIIMISFYRSIPASLFESAMLDGASEYRIFAKIALPLSKASLASIGLFYFIGHWNSYFLPLIYLQSAQKYPIQLVLKNMLMDESLQTTNLLVNVNIVPAALKNATIFITIIPVLIVYPLVQKHFVKGVMIGSVKG
ncbi:MAG: carbohydrate ABC transporter permease, partial [Clostridia bacterium]